MPVKPITPPPCDCLIHCGDDPWLRDGRATPCDRMKARTAEQVAREKADSQARADVAALRLSLAADAPRESINLKTVARLLDYLEAHPPT